MNVAEEKPEVGSVWTWKKGQPPWEVEIVVTDVAYFGFDWTIRVERPDGEPFEDGLRHFEVPLHRFQENAS